MEISRIYVNGKCPYPRAKMINKDGGQFLDFMGGHSCYEGDIELMGVPPLGKTLPRMAVFGRSAVVSPAFKKLQTSFLIENNNKNNRTIETKQ